jgi:hypothetical protein
MKFAIVYSTLILGVSFPLAAQTTPTPGPSPVEATTKLSIDSPIEAIVADAAGKAAIDASFPGMTSHPAYNQFKGMSLKQVQPMSQGAITDEAIAKVSAALSAIQ